MLRTTAVALTFCLASAGVALAQSQSSTADTRKADELVGCVSADPGASGSFTFSESTGSQYRLTGKSVRKYAGKMVYLMSGPQKKLAIRGGLWPSPNAAGQAGAVDPAQESIARQRGGATSGTGGFELPELRVVSVRGAGGTCK